MLKKEHIFIDRDADDSDVIPKTGTTATPSNSSDASDAKTRLDVQVGSDFFLQCYFIKGMGEVKSGETRFAYVTFKLKNDESAELNWKPRY